MSSVTLERPPEQVDAQIRGDAVIADALDEPMSAHTITRLASVDPEHLDDDLRVPLIRAWERADAWLQARKQRALAAVADVTIRSGHPGEEARFEVGAAPRLSPNTAADRVWVADKLTGHLRATLAAMETGDVTYLQAHNLAHAVVGLTDDQVAAVEQGVLCRAPDQSLADTNEQSREPSRPPTLSWRPTAPRTRRVSGPCVATPVSTAEPC